MKKNGIIKTCKQCGKEFFVKPSCLSRKYCSHKCYGKALENKTTKVCLFCGEKFEIYPCQTTKRKFCSKKCVSLWQSKAFKGEKSPSWKGGKVERNCEICGKKFYIQKHLIKKGRGRFCSNICHGIWQSKNKRGEKHHCWKGGLSFSPYAPEFNKQLKTKIKHRDNYTCQKCGKTEAEQLKEINRKLTVHHIDYNKKNCRKENLITLCLHCNTKVNEARIWWQGYFVGRLYQKNATFWENL